MTNDSIEQVLEAGKKRKPNNRTLEKELGVHWGLMKGKSNQKGVGNPKGYPGPANTQWSWTCSGGAKGLAGQRPRSTGRGQWWLAWPWSTHICRQWSVRKRGFRSIQGIRWWLTKWVQRGARWPSGLATFLYLRWGWEEIYQKIRVLWSRRGFIKQYW